MNETKTNDLPANYAIALLQRRMTVLDRQAQELRGDPTFEAQLPAIEEAIFDCQRACRAIAVYEREQPRGLATVTSTPQGESEPAAGDVETTPQTPNAKKRGRPKKSAPAATEPPPAAPEPKASAPARTPDLFPSGHANGHAATDGAGA